MKRTELNSKAIKSVSHNTRKREMRIEFHSRGTWLFKEVPAEVPEHLVHLDQTGQSAGKFYNSDVHKQYQSERIA